MRVRNCTGIPQGIANGARFPVNTWLRVPQDVSLQEAMYAFRLRIVELDASDGDKDALWREADGTHIFWMSPFSQGDGYATAAENMVLALDRLGFKLHVQSCWFVELIGLERRTMEMLLAPHVALTRVGICMATPGEFRRLPTPYRIGITMYEADDVLRGHPEWRYDIQQADMLAVPSEYCAEIFGKIFKGPIEVAPLAVNPIYYQAKRRQPKDTFTFITWGTLNGRKSPLETMDVFQKAFPKDRYPDVRMEFKTRLGLFGWSENQLPQIPDPRITIHNDNWDIARLRDWLLQKDCCLFLSKGEGFGMPPREAMATGMPVIFPDHTGLKSLVDDRYNWPVPIGRIERDSPLGGSWRIPDWDYAIDVMRWMYDHREEAFARAEQGAHWFINNHGADVAGRRLADIIEQVDPSSSVRPSARPAERIGKRSARANKPFYQKIVALAKRPGPILDVGVGEGLVYAALSDVGYEMWGVVFPGQKQAIEAKLRKRGYTPRIIEWDLFNLSRATLSSLGAPKFALCVSQGVLQHYTLKQIRLLIKAQLETAKKIMFSVPTVHYPKMYDLDSNMWMRDHWRDIMLGFESSVDYYGKGDRYLSIEVKGPAKRGMVPVFQRGRVLDGIWHNRVLEQKREVAL